MNKKIDKVWIKTKKDTKMKFISGTVKNPVHTYEEARKISEKLKKDVDDHG